MTLKLRYHQETLFCLLVVFLLAATALSWVARRAAESLATHSHPLRVERTQEDGGFLSRSA